MQDDCNLPGARYLSYLDFELEVGPGSGREYPVTVMRSPAGEAREVMRFPFGELELQNRLQALQIALLRSGGKRREILSPEEQAVRDFGQSLFDALLIGEVRIRYDVSQREAAGQGKGLRLKLRIQPPELAVLPWEFLYNPREAEYMCLSRDTPMVRYLELPRVIRPLTATLPLRILGMVANPRHLSSLDVTLEKQRVEEAIKDLQADGLVELTWLPGQTWRDLLRAMRGGPWHIFHFIGHGGFDRNADEGFVALADKRGEIQRLSATQLSRMLADHRSLRLALLNACEGARGSGRHIFSSTATILVRRGIPAVVAMQYEITDGAAIEFACTFYEVVAEGLPVDAAVTEARKAISLAVTNTVEWGVPVLYMRAPDGVLFSTMQKLVVAQKRPAIPAPEPKSTPSAQQPVIGEIWFRSKANIYLLTDHLARAAAGGEVPPFTDALSDLPSLESVTLDQDSIRVEEGDVIFSVEALDQNGDPGTVWVRARANRERVAKSLEEGLLEGYARVQSKEELPEEPEPETSPPVLTPVSSETVARFAASGAEIKATLPRR